MGPVAVGLKCSQHPHRYISVCFCNRSLSWARRIHTCRRQTSSCSKAAPARTLHTFNLRKNTYTCARSHTCAIRTFGFKLKLSSSRQEHDPRAAMHVCICMQAWPRGVAHGALATCHAYVHGHDSSVSLSLSCVRTRTLALNSSIFAHASNQERQPFVRKKFGQSSLKSSLRTGQTDHLERFFFSRAILTFPR